MCDKPYCIDKAINRNDRYEEFKISDLAAAIEALQVTFGNILEDHDISPTCEAGVVVTEYLWDNARKGKYLTAAMNLGYLTCWALTHGVESKALAMRIEEVKNELR